MKDKMKTGFWASGSAIYNDELEKEGSRRMAELRRQLQEAGALDEKKRIEKLLVATQTEFRQKRKNATYSLFAGQ